MRWPISFVILLCLVLSRTTGRAIPAAELKESYQPIIERNPFGLKPPPPPPTNNTSAVKQDKPKTEIFLTGITSIGYPRFPKQAYIMTKEQGAKEPKYYALTEGVEKDGIRVLEIDPNGRKVRVKWDNEETLLSFQTHGVAPPAAPALGKPGAPGVAGQPGQPGAAVPPGMPQPGVAVPLPSVDHSAGGTPQPISQPTASGYSPNATVTYRQIPSRTIRGGGTGGGGYGYNSGLPNAAPGGGLQPQQEQVDPAEQYLRMHLDKTVKEKQGIPMPPIPPM